MSYHFEPICRSFIRLGLRAIAIAALMLVIVPAVPAQQDQGILAIVNDDIISQYDLQNRLALFLATSNLPDTPENRRRMAPEVLRTLIDEALKRQEMRRQNITVSQAEIDRALAQIAAQLRISPDQLPALLATRGVSMPTLIDQVEAELGWLKAINRVAGDRANVSAEDVDEELARNQQAAGQIEYRLAELFLPVDDPAEQARILDQAQQLATEVRGGANFAALARTFSQSPSASAGGDLGWVPSDQLEQQIQQVVAVMQPGQVSDPIRGQGGYFVLQLAGRRAGGGEGGHVGVALQQVFLPLPATASEPQVSAAALTARNLAEGVTSCAELEGRAAKAGAKSSQTPGLVDIQQLPPDLRDLVQPLSVGEVSQPVRTQDGFVAIMVCERKEQSAGEEQRANVERRLRDQRLSAVARQYLRDLRRKAILDIRG
jgi:peptidyl-prolyl cis-trans isomerase SurA